MKLSGPKGGSSSPRLYYTYAAFADGKFANASRPISLSDLGRRVQDPGSLVLEFDGRTRTIAKAHPGHLAPSRALRRRDGALPRMAAGSLALVSPLRGTEGRWRSP